MSDTRIHVVSCTIFSVNRTSVTKQLLLTMLPPSSNHIMRLSHTAGANSGVISTKVIVITELRSTKY